MIIPVSIIFFILSITFWYLCVMKWNCLELEPPFMISALAFAVISIICIVLVLPRFEDSGAKARDEQIYKSLVYKAENADIRDEFGLLNKEYLDEVQEWNSNLAKNKSMQHNFWIGIFYPQYSDELDFINIENFAEK